LLAALPATGTAVLDAGDPNTPGLAARTDARVVRVAVEGRAEAADADVRAHSVHLDDELRPSFTFESPWGEGRICLPLRGAHQVTNGALAATVALALGVSFEQAAAGLATARAARGRLDVVRTPSGLVILDDAYNASPASMAAAIEALTAVPTRGARVAVLGEMRELGDDSASAHDAVGRLLGHARVDLLVAVGAETAPLASAARASGTPEVVETLDATGAMDVLRDRIGDDDVVLVKGSRAVGLDAVVRALTEGGVAP
jgi:UDP-N-acetylmuramoyl-tripeptide--D-alanyl-D-alanine ligase